MRLLTSMRAFSQPSQGTTNMNTTTATTASETLTDRCRDALAKMTFGTSVLAHKVDPEARLELLARCLVHEDIDGYLTPTMRAQGYTHDPETFEAEAPLYYVMPSPGWYASMDRVSPFGEAYDTAEAALNVVASLEVARIRGSGRRPRYSVVRVDADTQSPPWLGSDLDRLHRTQGVR